MKKSNNLINKKNQPKTEDSDKNEFLMWLQNKLQVQTEQELQQKLQELGEEGLKEAYAMFQQEKNQTTATMMKMGGKANKIKKLYEMKCGSKMKKSKKEDGGKLKLFKAQTADLKKDCCK